MADNNALLPIPPSVRDRLSMLMGKVPADSGELRFAIRKAFRAVYAEGYDDGHRDGSREAQDDHRAEREMQRELDKDKKEATP